MNLAHLRWIASTYYGLTPAQAELLTLSQLQQLSSPVIGAQGGFLVPQEFVASLEIVFDETEVVAEWMHRHAVIPKDESKPVHNWKQEGF